jgi:hypothetical protein
MLLGYIANSSQTVCSVKLRLVGKSQSPASYDIALLDPLSAQLTRVRKLLKSGTSTQIRVIHAMATAHWRQSIIPAVECRNDKQRSYVLVPPGASVREIALLIAELHTMMSTKSRAVRAGTMMDASG